MLAVKSVALSLHRFCGGPQLGGWYPLFLNT
jgi:hypothetical protein